MKLRVKSTSHMVKGFILMTEWVDKSEKDAEKKKKKFLKEVKANDQFEVPDELGHKLMSKYEDNLEVISYGKSGPDDLVTDNKMATPKETK